MAKRGAHELLAGSEALQQDTAVLRSRSGRTVKPKVWDDSDYDAQDVEDFAREVSEDRSDRRDAKRSDNQDSDSAGASSDGSYGSRGHSGSRRDGGPRPVRTPRGAGGVFKQAAVEILQQERRLMQTTEMTKLAIQRGLISIFGKTPEATMASALYTDIKRKEGTSIFIRPQEGLFGLREWVNHGQVPASDAETASASARPRSNLGPFASAAPAGAHASGKRSPRHADDSADDSADRLMELLSAAEEINRSSADELEEADRRDGATADGGPAGNETQRRQPPRQQQQPLNDEDGASVGKGAPAAAWPAEHGGGGGAKPSRRPPRPTAPACKAPAPAAAAAAAAAAALRGMTPEQLRSAEAAAAALERQLGQSHPEVGKAYLALARMYVAGSAMPAPARALVEAALGQAQEVMAGCQEAQQPPCAPSFTYLMERVKGEARAKGSAAANGDAAHVRLQSAAPAGQPHVQVADAAAATAATGSGSSGRGTEAAETAPSAALALPSPLATPPLPAPVKA